MHDVDANQRQADDDDRADIPAQRRRPVARYPHVRPVPSNSFGLLLQIEPIEKPPDGLLADVLCWLSPPSLAGLFGFAGLSCFAFFLAASASCFACFLAASASFCACFLASSAAFLAALSSFFLPVSCPAADVSLDDPVLDPEVVVVPVPPVTSTTGDIVVDPVLGSGVVDVVAALAIPVLRIPPTVSVNTVASQNLRIAPSSRRPECFFGDRREPGLLHQPLGPFSLS